MDGKSSSPFFQKVRKVTCCQNDKSKSLDRTKREDLLNKLKNLRPKYNPEVFSDDDDYTIEFYPRQFVKPKKMSYLDRKKSNSHSERAKMSIGNRGKVLFKERPVYSRRNEVCDRSDDSSRSSNKMHCYCYDQSQGSHYSRRYFENFQYGTEVTSLEAMSSSLDASPLRMKKEQKLKSSFSTGKKGTCERSANRNCTNLSCESLVVNHSPGTNVDYLSNDRKKNRRRFKKSAIQDFVHYQCSSESSCPDDFQKRSRGFRKNQKGGLDDEKRFRAKGDGERFDCCCGVEEKVRADCPYYCRCPGSYSSENDDDNYREETDDEEEKEFKNEDRTDVQSLFQRKVKSEDKFRLEDLTPDLPLPNHWTKCGDHLTKVTNEYRHLTDTLKSMQSLAEDQSSNKTTRKKFTRTYPSGKKFTFEVKSAEDAASQETKGSRCECQECPLLLKTWEKIKNWGNGRESKILRSYNNLMKSKNLLNGPVNNIIDGKPPHISPRGKATNQRSINQFKNSGEMESLDKVKSDPDVCDCEKIILKDKILKDKMRKDKIRKDDILRNKKNPESKVNFPRIAKPSGDSCKVNLRKIFIHPPHGEEGPPLTLYKKSSNIDCRIKGDAVKGFRYKVTYKQKFVSPIWHSKDGASPFRKKENTTEYG